MSKGSLFNVVLVHPEIPSNTGNIGRTCVGLCSQLHLVKPLGFEINDKQLKRAGLDYWPYLKYKIHSNWEGMQRQFFRKRVFYLSTKGKTSIYNCRFEKGDWFIFGSESKGLGSLLLDLKEEEVLTIPVPGSIRSLNLANAVSITIFEAYRQVTMRKD